MQAGLVGIRVLGVRALRGTTGVSRRRGQEELERPAQVGFERVRKKRAEESRLVARGAVTAPLETRRRTDPRIHRAAFFRRAHTPRHTHAHALTALRLHPRTDMTPQWLRLLAFFPLLCAGQRRPVGPASPVHRDLPRLARLGPRFPVALLAPLAPFSTHLRFPNRDCLQI